MTTELEEARAAEKAATERRQAAERAEREAIGYPEFDTPEWQKHQSDLAQRYHDLEMGQRVRMYSVPGIHGDSGPTQTGGSTGTWQVMLHSKDGLIQFYREADGVATACTVNYASAYPFGMGSILKELEVVSEPPDLETQNEQ